MRAVHTRSPSQPPPLQHACPLPPQLRQRGVVPMRAVQAAPVSQRPKSQHGWPLPPQSRQMGDAAMRGATRPVTLRAHRPMLDEANAGRTDVPESAALYHRAATHEAEPGILAVSINAAFSEADISEMGVTVLVTHDEAEARAMGQRGYRLVNGQLQLLWG